MSVRLAIVPVAYGVALVSIGAIVSASIMRSIQFQQPDPYNNVYTTISTLLLFVFFVAWLVLSIVMIRFREARTGLRSTLLWIVLSAGGLWIAWFLFSLLWFVSGGLGQNRTAEAVADQRAAAPQLKVSVNVQPLTMIRSGAARSA